ncbi:MAG: cell division/cell wall cluster transcriptional repressor MraZ [Planctomycetes bacterium]|nr:cell division/cell wall cluster transcriptional repressor MraZ [Planctomycetota bacterium]
MDKKKRLIIPAEFRAVLEEEQPQEKGFWATIGMDKCIYMYTPRGWAALKSYFSDNPFQKEESRYVERWFYANARFLELDPAGRILLPDALKDIAGISDKVVLVGINCRIELWSPERWAAFQARVEPNFDRYAEEVHEEAARRSQAP